MNDDKERKGWQAGRVYSFQLKIPGGIQSGFKNDWEKLVWCFLSLRHPRVIPVYHNSCTLLFSGLRSLEAAGILSALFSERSVNGWMCYQITTPWQINTKTLQHQTYAIEKLRDSIITPRRQKHFFLKILKCLPADSLFFSSFSASSSIIWSHLSVGFSGLGLTRVSSILIN